jgi:predicted metalloprotease with PDZ domain
MKNAIRYTIVPKDLAGHLFEVSVTVASPAADGQKFMLPSWIPGSYMIREFARHIVQVRAESGGKAIKLVKIDKHTWEAASAASPLTLTYDVYAWDLSVRTAHLDQTHAFFNGSSVFLRVAGYEHEPHVVDIRRPAETACKTWRVATTLPELRAKRHGFGTYVAADYDELIDHPVELGNFAFAAFDAHGVRHEIAVTGRVPNLDLERLSSDLKKICEKQIAFFEPETTLAPVERYLFLIMAVGEGYGGLEHRASTALLCSRNDLPATGGGHSDEGYENFLGLCSHEYFHTWHVKRIKPAAFAPYDLQNENYTPLLWLFEGFTSYYDDLFLVRSGVIDVSAYLRRIARTINGVLRSSGHAKQSLADASFDAWIKFYRQDENSPNVLSNYYTKGSLVALALDLTIRSTTKGRRSLDHVMHALWHRYGRDFYAPQSAGLGVTAEEVEALVDEISGLKLRSFFASYVYGTDELPLAELLARFGVAMNDERKRNKPGFDIRIVRAGGDCRLANVYEDGAAHRAGLSAGDLLVAVDGLRVTTENSATGLDKLLERYSPGTLVTVHAFRRDELMTFEVRLDGENAPQFALTAQDKPQAAVAARRDWLKSREGPDSVQYLASLRP